MLKSALLVVLATGCANVNVEVEEVRIAYRDIEIKAGDGVHAANKSFVFEDLSAIRDLVDYGAEISFVGAELRATAGIDTLAFIEQTSITLDSGAADSALPSIVAFGCGHCETRGPALTLPSQGKHDATSYVSSGSLLLGLDLLGRMPGRPWTLDFEIVLEARLDHALVP